MHLTWNWKAESWGAEGYKQRVGAENEDDEEERGEPTQAKSISNYHKETSYSAG